MALPPEARRPKPKAKPKAKKKAYTLPKTIKTDSTTRTGSPKLGPPTPAPRRPAPKSQPGPYPNKERKAVEKHKTTPTYRAAVKVAYRSRPLADRQRRVSEIINKLSGPRRVSARDGRRLSTEDLAVLDTYLRRARRDDTLMKSPAFSDRQRKLVESFKQTPQFQKALLEARFPVTDKRYADLFEVDRDKLKRMGFHEPDKLEKIVGAPTYGLSTLAGALESAAAVGEAAYHDPIGVPLKTAKQLPMAVAGVPVAAINTVLHPVKTAKAFNESITTPYAQKVRRIRKGGALEDIGNAAVLVPSVAGAGKFALRGAAPRALKLDSGGTGRRPRTNGPVRYVVGSRIDDTKAKRYERLVAKGRPLTALQNEALQRNRKAGRTVAVVPLVSGAKIRRHGVAKARGAAIAGLRFARSRGPLAKLAKQKYRLNPDEQKALWAAMEAGIHTPEAAREHLPRLIDKMEETRSATPSGWEKDMDVIAQLREMEANPEKHFTPNLQSVLKDIEKVTDEISDNEPQFKDLTKQGRRRAVQAYLLDLERGVLDDPATSEWVYVPGIDDLKRTAAKAAEDVDIDGDLAGVPRPVAGLVAQRSADAHPKQAVLDDLAGVDLEDLPGEVNVPNVGRMQFRSNKEIQDTAAKYTGDLGIDNGHPSHYVKVDPDFAARVAEAFDEMEHKPNDPEVKAAYDALKRETLAQYQAAIDAGYKFEFYPEGADPYPNSPREAVLDLVENKHMYVYPTEAGFGTEGVRMDHPLLEDSGIRWNGKPVTYNDVFRAIHDFYGHAKEGLGFRADGEDNAWRQHAAMFSPEARRAMTTETRGQNSWVNFGPHGEKNRTASTADTTFADQKAGLLPEWVSDPGPAPDGARLREEAARLREEAAAAREIGDNVGDVVARARYAARLEREADALEAQAGPAPEPDPGPVARRAGDDVDTPDDSPNGAGYFEERQVPPGARYVPETDEEFFDRIDRTAAEAGLAKPMYFKSEKQRGLETDYGAKVAGGGRAKSTGKPYQGKNLGEGIFDTSFEQMLRGYEHNVKARFNYDLVIELNRRNRLASIVPEERGVELGEALNRVNRHEPRLDKGSVALVNLGLFKKYMHREPGTDLEVADAPDALDAGLAQALAKSVVEDTDNVDTALLKTNGWQVWPKAALRELEAELHASSVGGRAFDIVKGNLSKMILLTGNLPWMAIQLVSETAVAAIASKGRAFTPRNIAGTVRMWKAMDDQQRGEVAGAMGLGATGADAQVVKMGSSINRGFGHTWRMFKAQDFWHKPRVAGQPVATLLNPVKWMRAADQGKTNVLRLLYAHQELAKQLPSEKVEAVAGALENMSAAARAIDKVMPVFKKPPAEQLAYLRAHPELLDDVAESTANALGDWTTLTASERTWANRFVMFYPYVRYSTRLMLYTMPVDHPAVSAVLAELGALQADEYREIFGSDQLPWNIGMVYFDKAGESAGIDLRRAHPGMNAIFDLATSGGDASKLLSAAPPYVQWAVDQATSGSLFGDRDWRTDGGAAPYGAKALDYGSVFDPTSTRFKVLLDDALSLSYAYRVAEERTQEGVQGDDALLGFPAPVKFHPEGSIDELEAKFAREHGEFEESKEDLGSALLGPLYPQPSDAKKQSERRAYIEKLRKQAKGGKTKSPFKGRGKTTPFKTRSGGSPFRSGR